MARQYYYYYYYYVTSVMARPQRGKAGQAMLLRVISSISWIILMPCIFRHAWEVGWWGGWGGRVGGDEGGRGGTSRQRGRR